MIKGDLVLDAEFGVEGAIKEQLEIPETLWVLKNESGEMRVFVKKCSEEKCTSQNCPSALWLKQGENTSALPERITNHSGSLRRRRPAYHSKENIQRLHHQFGMTPATIT